jgi:peptidoglycan LD-endopeptidase LytH
MKQRRVHSSTRPVAAVLVATLLTALAVSPVLADSSDTAKKIDSAKGEIGNTEADIKAAEAKLNGLVDVIAGEQQALDALQAEADALATQIDQVQSRIARTQDQITKKRSQIKAAQEQLDLTKAQLNQRAWVAYENGPGGGLEFLLGSTSLADFSDRLEIVNRAVQSDQDLIIQIRGQQEQLELRQQELVDLEKGLRTTQADLLAKQAELGSKLASERDTLVRLAKDKADAESIVSQLEAKEQEQASAIKRLEAELAKEQAAEAYARAHPPSPPGGGGGGGGGSIPGVFQVCPVDAPHAYGDDFGAPRYSGGYHPHAGNDIFSPMGTPIRATFAGTAVDATNGLGGRAVKVYGASGWTYNAHLSALGTLGSVSAGTIVGYVGNSGDAGGTPTHDHFEWHPSTIPSPLHVSPYGYSNINGAIDPWPYLNSVC